MAAIQLSVDDVNPFIFSNGDWDQYYDFEWAFNNTRSGTRRAGAYKVIRFIGTSITVLGGLQPIAGSRHDTTLIVCQFSIDNAAPTVYAPEETTQYVRVTYYQSPTLPMGEHVLTMMNMAEDDLIWLDYFTIQGTDSSAPMILKSDGARIPTAHIPATSTRNSASSLLSPSSSALPTIGAKGNTPVPVSAPLMTSVDGRSSSVLLMLNSPSIPTSNPTSSPTPAPLSSLVSFNPAAPVTTYQSTIINAQNSQKSSEERFNLPAIVSGTCGGLLVISLVIALLVSHRRRRHQILKKGQLEESIRKLKSTTHPFPYEKMPVAPDGSSGTESQGELSLPRPTMPNTYPRRLNQGA